MSEKALFLTDQAMFWFARGDSVNGGRRSYWERLCRELAADLIGAGCDQISIPSQDTQAEQGGK